MIISLTVGWGWMGRYDVGPQDFPRIPVGEDLHKTFRLIHDHTASVDGDREVAAVIGQSRTVSFPAMLAAVTSFFYPPVEGSAYL
jgi:hypothetical protein